jgi:hypothetical protein
MSRRQVATPEPRLRVVAIGWPNEQRVALLNQLGYVYRAGGEPILIVADRAAWEPISRPIRVIELPPERQLSPIDRAVAIPPRRLALGAYGWWRARRAKSRIGRILVLLLMFLGVTRRSRSRPGWWPTWERTQFYADTRGWAYWEALAPHAHEIQPATLDYILFRDLSAWPVAWHLAEDNPDVKVGASVPADELVAFVSARREWLRTQPGHLYKPILAWLKFLPIRLLRSAPVKWAVGKAPRGLKDKVKLLLAR